MPLNLNAVKAAVQNKPKAEEKPAATDSASTSVVTEEVSGQQRAFTQAQLDQQWKNFFVQLKDTGSPIEMLLTSAVLQLENNHAVTVLLNSSLQEEPFERLKPRLQHFLRQQLQNGQLSIKHQVIEESGPRRLYTNSEKFQHLLERYPLLSELKERLGLEADF